MIHKRINMGLLAAVMAAPLAAHAGEPVQDDYFSALAETAPGAAAYPYLAGDGGSAGGYVRFGSPSGAASGADGAALAEPRGDGVEFGVNWRPDVGAAANQERRASSLGLSGKDVGRVGVRADLTALLYDETSGEGDFSAWRLTGMLGSTSLSLIADENDPGAAPAHDSGDLLWDVGIGWSSGAMSLTAGYRSDYSLDLDGEAISPISILSLGADYTLVPGLSVYGELNMFDSAPDDGDDGLGTSVIIGTGVNF